jgi:antagonist of SinR
LTTELKVIGELDVEWIQLILEALEMGIDKEDIREFLTEKKAK